MGVAKHKTARRLRLRLIGAGGKIPTLEPDGVRLDNGMRLKNQELLRATRPSHAVNHSALQRDLGEDVVAQVAQHSAGVGQLGAAQVDVVVCHHTDELKDLLPAGDEARAQHVAHAVGEAGGAAGCRVRKLLAQLQVVQNEPVAVVGNAQAVRGLAIGGGGQSWS